MIKVGIVGCGHIANQRHIPAFLKLRKYVELKAICDINEALAQSVAKNFGVSSYYSSLQNMLKNEDLDIIDICTPPRVHLQLAVEAAEYGCHVLMEKPMALKASDCDLMIEAAQKSGVILSVVHNELFYPVMTKAEKFIDEGKLGEIVGMRWLRLTPRSEYASLSKHWIHNLPGGILGETGPHAVYTSLRFIGRIKNANIIAKKSSPYPWLLFDDYRIELVGERAVSSIMISHATDRLAAKIELIGTKGLIIIDLYGMIFYFQSLKDLEYVSLAKNSISTIGQTFANLVNNSASVILGKSKFSHDIFIEKFVKSIMSDQPPPILPSESRETVRVMELLVEKISNL